jgi:hypothetical protein
VNWPIFIAGFLGSVGLEFVEVIAAYQHRGRLPARYRRKGFWFVRLSFALIAGALPVLFRITNTAQAFAIGVSAPIVFRLAWQKGLGGHIPPSTGLH